MKSITLLGIAVAILLPAQGGSASAGGERTLKGRFEWNQGSKGDLEAVFTATGQDRWDIDFHFRFRGRSHTYTGTAKGSLADGELEGKVRNESRRRTFTFSGEFENGIFRGTHAEVYGSRQQRTGTLTLRHGSGSDVL